MAAFIGFRTFYNDYVMSITIICVLMYYGHVDGVAYLQFKYFGNLYFLSIAITQFFPLLKVRFKSLRLR